jgi:serine protease inhibitor
MDFIHLANLGRRLIQVPALSIRGALKATYDSELDATAVEIPYTTRELSLILIMPGKSGEFAIGGITSLKSRLTLEAWTGLMRGLYARDPFKIVFPRFRSHSSLNLTSTMQRFGLTDMFQPHQAKFKGINGLSDLHMDQNVMHFAEFGTWEKLADSLSEATDTTHKKFDLVRILRPHVREHYGNYGEPMSVNDWVFMSRTPAPLPRNSNMSPPNSFTYTKVRSTRSRHGRVAGTEVRAKSPPLRIFARQEPGEAGEEKVLRFERPFVYLLRHNPTGMILMTGQYTEPVTGTQETQSRQHPH